MQEMAAEHSWIQTGIRIVHALKWNRMENDTFDYTLSLTLPLKVATIRTEAERFLWVSLVQYGRDIFTLRKGCVTIRWECRIGH